MFFAWKENKLGGECISRAKGTREKDTLDRTHADPQGLGLIKGSPPAEARAGADDGGAYRELLSNELGVTDEGASLAL